MRIVAPRLSELQIACLLATTPFLMFPSCLSVPALPILLLPWLARWRANRWPTVRSPKDIPILCLLLMARVSLWASALPEVTLSKLQSSIQGAPFFESVASTATRAIRV